MTEIQVWGDGIGREPPANYSEFLERLRPIIDRDFADLEIGSAMVTRGEENIRYNNLLSHAVAIAGSYPIKDPLRMEFFKDLHFWSGIPMAEMLNWKNREVLARMVSNAVAVAKERRG